ncbi:hypothetical protein POJ06DRAFT_39283 [Lipomyces tetrasporus]|uniref:Uncharacterized protein n=1 Tax=Lipomyces tetrasporus TaxID=54092 RepID=A0AAD7VQE3_9ASCO|nr:uncharacterized protein POJ06DRAFT_39283 [Lipomyces tetrasporus]KAJ8097075.1 hypothetical protein POJ06DRAFT_39283 [Lipomyces tetrasporus]
MQTLILALQGPDRSKLVGEDAFNNMQIDDVEIESLIAKVSSQVSRSDRIPRQLVAISPRHLMLLNQWCPAYQSGLSLPPEANGAQRNVSYEKELGTLLSSLACEYFEQLSYQRASNFLMDNEPEKRLDVRISPKRAGSCTLWRREISRLQYSAIDSKVIMNTVPTALHGLSAFAACNT